ncbi:hypothetical protein QVD17_00421 [Tagetes erecta]|uniref:Uncharacterized protein n=1 Tax=Tagetes erecta TaxID=13708 RepID=A0AAD8P773_TARER|nr:hypothetical protein QVD17_00421 [Tagetes erecta]
MLLEEKADDHDGAGVGQTGGHDDVGTKQAGDHDDVGIEAADDRDDVGVEQAGAHDAVGIEQAGGVPSTTLDGNDVNQTAAVAEGDVVPLSDQIV